MCPKCRERKGVWHGHPHFRGNILLSNISHSLSLSRKHICPIAKQTNKKEVTYSFWSIFLCVKYMDNKLHLSYKLLWKPEAPLTLTTCHIVDSQLNGSYHQQGYLSVTFFQYYLPLSMISKSLGKISFLFLIPEPTMLKRVTGVKYVLVILIIPLTYMLYPCIFLSYNGSFYRC